MKISIFKLVIEYIYILNLFKDINVNIIYYKLAFLDGGRK
jgi:hypothetical protein